MPERTVVEAIFITPDAAAPVREVGSVRAVAGRGLEGDRYFEARGTWSRHPGGAREITLIDADDLDDAALEFGVELRNGAHRRNVVTRGVDLRDLIGKRFWVGGALCEGLRDCAPCGHMERLAAPGARAALEGRGGLRAEIRESGLIRRGDPIRVA